MNTREIQTYQWMKDCCFKTGKGVIIDGELVRRSSQGSAEILMKHSHTGELEWVNPRDLKPYPPPGVNLNDPSLFKGGPKEDNSKAAEDLFPKPVTVPIEKTLGEVVKQLKHSTVVPRSLHPWEKHDQEILNLQTQVDKLGERLERIEEKRGLVLVAKAMMPVTEHKAYAERVQRLLHGIDQRATTLLVDHPALALPWKRLWDETEEILEGRPTAAYVNQDPTTEGSQKQP